MTATIEALEAEWELETGFFGRLREGRFDSRGYARALDLLHQLEPPGESLNTRLVSLVWYIPIFMHWQRDRCIAAGADIAEYDQALNRLSGCVEEYLGVP